MTGRRDHQKGGIIRMGIRSVAGGVGLASESLKAHKESKERKTDRQEHASTSCTNSEGIDNLDLDVGASDNPRPLHEIGVDDTGHDLENEWDLDDAQDDIIDDSEGRPAGDNNELEDAFLREHPPPGYAKDAPPTGKLSFPVILPQRRPKNRSRGFIRAYAPVLESCRIDQATWLALRLFRSLVPPTHGLML